MTAVTFTETHNFVGDMAGGRKMLFTTLVPDNGTDPGTVYLPLSRVLSWMISTHDPGDVPTTFRVSFTEPNTLTITPAGDPTGAVLKIMAIGV